MFYPLVIIIDILLGLSIVIFIFFFPFRIRTRSNFKIPLVHYTHFALLCTIAFGAIVLQRSTSKGTLNRKVAERSVSTTFCYVHLAFTSFFFTLSIALASSFLLPLKWALAYGLISLNALAVAGSPQPQGRFMCGFSRWGLLLLFTCIYITPGLLLCRNRYGGLLLCLWLWWMVRLSVLITDLVPALLLAISTLIVLVKPASQL